MSLLRRGRTTLTAFTVTVGTALLLAQYQGSSQAGANDMVWHSCTNPGAAEQEGQYTSNGVLNYRYGGYSSVCPADQAEGDGLTSLIRLYVRDSNNNIVESIEAVGELSFTHPNRVGKTYCGWVRNPEITYVGSPGQRNLYCKYYRY